MPPALVPPHRDLIPLDILRDLACRFTANIPREERDNIRICFQIELAHWLFIDHYCKPSDKLNYLGHIPFNIFAWLMFQVTPYLQAYTQQDVEKILTDFKEYKSKVPTYGAILMDERMSQVLLVQGFGNSWMFPKGKVNKDEEAVVCAIREVKEETGYDITKLVNANHFIESNANDRNARLYLVVGVDTLFPFKPQTQYEIRQIGWFDVDELPENKKDVTSVTTRGYQVNQFYPIFSFVKRLKRWIADKKSGTNQINCFRCLNSSMRFPYSSDKRTLWEMESPKPSNTPATAPPLATAVASVSGGNTSPTAIGRSLLQKTFGSKPVDDKKWATRFQAIQGQEQLLAHPSKSEPMRGHQEKLIATRSKQDKTRQVKRRLQFDEQNQKPAPARNKTTEGNRMSSSRTKTATTSAANANFFDGPGAQAWLNFTLSLNDFL